MPKKGLVRRLEQKHELDLSREREEGIAAGWNIAVTLISKHYEPLCDAWVEIEHRIGVLRGAVLIAHKIDKLPAFAAELATIALEIGYFLNEADSHNRALSAALHVNQFIDLSQGQAIRDAALNYRDGKDSGGKALVALLQEPPALQRFASAIDALKPIRNRGREEYVKDIHNRVKRKVLAGRAVTQAAAEVSGDLSREGIEYNQQTVRNYYYRIEREKKV